MQCARARLHSWAITPNTSHFWMNGSTFYESESKAVRVVRCAYIALHQLEVIICKTSTQTEDCELEIQSTYIKSVYFRVPWFVDDYHTTIHHIHCFCAPAVRISSRATLHSVATKLCSRFQKPTSYRAHKFPPKMAFLFPNPFMLRAIY